MNNSITYRNSFFFGRTCSAVKEFFIRLPLPHNGVKIFLKLYLIIGSKPERVIWRWWILAFLVTGGGSSQVRTQTIFHLPDDWDNRFFNLLIEKKARLLWLAKKLWKISIHDWVINSWIWINCNFAFYNIQAVLWLQGYLRLCKNHFVFKQKTYLLE